MSRKLGCQKIRIIKATLSNCINDLINNHRDILCKCPEKDFTRNKDNEALKHYHEALDIDSKLGNIDDMILTAEYIADLYQRNNMKEDEKMYRDWIEELLEEFG